MGPGIETNLDNKFSNFQIEKIWFENLKKEVITSINLMPTTHPLIDSWESLKMETLINMCLKSSFSVWFKI